MSGTVAQTLAVQIEKLRGGALKKMWLTDHGLFNRLTGTEKDIVSDRPERIPLAVLSGGKTRQWNPDGGDMGRGSMPTTTFGNLAPCFVNHDLEWTTLYEKATDNKQKATTDMLEFGLDNGMEQFKSDIDSLLSYGDTTNTLGVVTSYSTANGNYALYVDNANRFHDGQDVDVYTAIGTAAVETITILSVDGPNKVLYLTAAPATAPAQGNLLLLNNATGTAGTGMAGPLAYNVAGNTGTYLGINKSQFPGKFSTPHIAAGGQAITPAMARGLQTYMREAMGRDSTPDQGYFYHMDLAQRAAWENTGLNVTQMQTGPKAVGRDLLPAEQVDNIGGIEIYDSVKAVPGRVDLLATKYWFQQEIIPLDFYELDGRTVFPIYGASGAPAAIGWSSLVWGGNFACTNVRKQAYIDGLLSPQYT